MTGRANAVRCAAAPSDGAVLAALLDAVLLGSLRRRRVTSAPHPIDCWSGRQGDVDVELRMPREAPGWAAAVTRRLAGARLRPPRRRAAIYELLAHRRGLLVARLVADRTGEAVAAKVRSGAAAAETEANAVREEVRHGRS